MKSLTKLTLRNCADVSPRLDSITWINEVTFYGEKDSFSQNP